MEFERFRPLLIHGLGYGDGANGGRPPFDPVAMFKVLVVQAQHNLSDARMEFTIRDRLSWMRFFDFDLGGAMPDENTIRHYPNRLTVSGTLEALMQAFEQQLREAGYLAMGGQIVDATLVPAPKQRNIEDEKAAIRASKSAKQISRGKPNKAHQKDVDARWTVKIGGNIRYRPDGTPLPQIATPVFGCKSHISIDRRFGFIRKAAVTSAADSAYRSGKNEAWLKANMLKSRIHRRKPQGKAMPEHMARANAARSAIRALGSSMSSRTRRTAMASSSGRSPLPARRPN